VRTYLTWEASTGEWRAHVRISFLVESVGE